MFSLLITGARVKKVHLHVGEALISSRIDLHQEGYILIFANFIHGRDEIDINGTNSEIYREKKKEEAKIICRERRLVIVGPSERDVQEMFEYSLMNRPA